MPSSSTIVILAAVTWLEGVRRLPADAIVLRQAPLAPWRVVEPPPLGGAWSLVAWWSPLTLPIVLTTAERPAAPASPSLEAALARTRWTRAILRVLGAVSLVALVVGVPLAAERAGGIGLLASVAALALLDLAIALLTLVALRRLRVSRRAALATSLRALWPFTAPRAAERVLAYAVAPHPPLVVAQALLAPAAFAAWLRPAVYDHVVRRRTLDGALAILPAVVPRALQDAALATVPEGTAPGEAFCPRCARVYRGEVARCGECEDVALASV